MLIQVAKNTITACVETLSPGDTFMHNGTFYIVTDVGEVPEFESYDLVWCINLDSGYCRTFPRDTQVEQVELAVVLKEDLHEL